MEPITAGAAVGIFQKAKDALTGVVISDVLRARLELAFDQAAVLESKVSELQSQAGELRAEIKIARTDEAKAKEESVGLKKLHEEDTAVVFGIEFRKGKRTKNQWLPFCPVCHVPIAGRGNSLETVECWAGKCNWRTNMTWHVIPEAVAGLG